MKTNGFKVAKDLVGSEMLTQMIEQNHIFVNSKDDKVAVKDNLIVLEKLHVVQTGLPSVPSLKSFAGTLDETLLFKPSGLRHLSF